MLLRALATALFVGSLALLPRSAFAAVPVNASPTSADLSPDANALDARQYRLDNARVPGATSARQSITAWQVLSGSWDGQALDGLSLVLVKTTAEDAGPSGRQFDCYVSHLATPAQRNALLNAFLSTQPGLLSPRDAAHMRIEPAIITIQFDNGAITLHLGLVA
jgi:hypothetical protein